MADGGSRPGPSRRDKGKAKVGESIDLSSDDDQSERNDLGPGSRCCLSKTLTPHDASPINPVLYLHPFEAATLIDSPDITNSPNSLSFSKNIRVLDVDSRPYNMLLSRCTFGGWTGYTLTRDWQKFVSCHNLEAGCTIFFQRSPKRDVYGDYYYILKYVRESEVNVSVSVPSNKSTYGVTCHIPQIPEKIGSGPGSRRMPKEAMCFSMILTPLEVTEQHPKLHLSPDDAYLLTDRDEVLVDPPGIFSQDLSVFDEFDRRYAMNLSNRESGSPTSFVLNTGWNRYVRTYNLKEGDELVFYRFSDSASGEFYYVLRFIRKPADKKRPGDENTSGRKTERRAGAGF